MHKYLLRRQEGGGEGGRDREGPWRPEDPAGTGQPPSDSAGKEQNNLGTLTAPAGIDEPLEARQEVDTSRPVQPRGKGEYGGRDASQDCLSQAGGDGPGAAWGGHLEGPGDAGAGAG